MPAVTSSPIDLWTLIVSSERLHPSFRSISGARNAPDRGVLTEWARGFHDRDGKFVQEFQTTFDSCFWELYLNASFRELGFTMDFSFNRPDFCVTAPQEFCVEATVAMNAAGAPAMAETDPTKPPSSFTEFNRQAVIRLSNSMHSKNRKYVDSYKKLAHVTGKPFVVAIAPFDRPHFQLQAQRAIEWLLYRYYVDEDAYLAKPPEERGPLLAEDRPTVDKDSGEPLKMGLFCDDSMSGISAVIQSTSATFSKVRVLSRDPDVIVTATYENRNNGGQEAMVIPNEVYSESVLDGLRVYHNPFAKHPLDRSLFERPEIFQATSKGPATAILLNDSRRNLVCRQVMTIPPGEMKRILEGEKMAASAP